MPGWIDKLKGRAQNTLQDPEKMDSIRSKISAAVSRRLAGGSQRGGYYGPGFDPGMTSYGDANYGAGDVNSQDAGGWNSGDSTGGGGWTDSNPSDSGGWDSGGSWDSGDSSDSGGGDGGGDGGGGD